MVNDKDIKHAVRTCRWRHTVGGVPICAGNCNICSIEIERGRCDTLKQLFANDRNEDTKEKK